MNINSSSLWNKNFLIYFLITCVFFTMSLIGILHHELWLDESHHWLLARDSSSITDLIENTKYEGHPILWNVLLFFISKLSSNPFWMQLLHISISTILVYIFLIKSPFNFLFKLLFIFSYFIFFEYTLLSRNYNLGILFLFLAISIYGYRKEKIILFSILLSITNNTHAIFIVITTCIMFIVYLESIKDGTNFSTKIILGISIFIIGTLIAIFQIIPPSDNSFFERTQEFSLFQRITRSFITFFKGVFIIPDFRTIHFWNSHYLVNISKSLSSILGVFSILFPLFVFYKNKIILLFVYLAILGTSLFFFVTQLSAPRYFGLNFLIIITGLWMENYYPLKKDIFNSWFSLLTHKKIRNTLLYSMLITQTFSGTVSYGFDLLLPFSSSKQTVEFLKKSELTNKIVITQWCEGTPLSSYLETPIFFTNTNDYQSYCIWNRQDLAISNSKSELIKSLENIINDINQSVIFITIKKIPLNEYKLISSSLEYKFLKSFTNNIVSKESYYIYEISKI